MRGRTFLLAVTLSLAFAAVANAQSFDSPKFEYTLDLPSPSWHLSSEPDDVSQAVEFINGQDRGEGLLKIRKMVVEAGISADQTARNDKDQNLRYQRGYVDGKQDSFSGRVKGVVLSYEYTNGGKPMAGLIYYLQTDNRTIYTLRFTGRRDKLLLLRNQTDLSARSFKLK